MIVCDGTVQTVTITGTGFPIAPIVLITAPNCAPATATVVSSSSTQIVASFAFVLCGLYAFQVTDSGGCASNIFTFLVAPSFVEPPIPPCIALGDLVAALADRLEDPGNVHWTQPELIRYVTEALRTWNAYTQSYRNRGSFQTDTGIAFYDLPTVLPTLRGYNVLDQDLVTDIEYTLMEPPTPTVWTGTEQFTLTDVTRALNQARDQFLLETGAVLSETLIPSFVPSPDGRVSLPLGILTLRRMAWIDTLAGGVTPLKREDEWALTNFARTWTDILTQPRLTWPTGFSVAVTPPLFVQLAPVPSASGSLDILAVNAGAVLDPTQPSGILLGVPDDWAWVVKFKALADLLSQEGLAWDPERAAYCRARWQHGVALASQASVVLNGMIEGEPTRLFSVSDTDKYRRSWQSRNGAPTAILTDGQNLVGVSSPPDQGPLDPVSQTQSPNGYQIVLDVVANMPIPTVLTECTVITEAIAEPILDYAQHLALAKEGVGQLQASMVLYHNFERATGVTVKLDQASVPYRGPIFRATSQDVSVLPRIVTPEPTGSDESQPGAQ